MQFWLDHCKNIFGQDLSPPTTDAVNKYYGGLDIKGDNIFFLNGSEDPWHYAAMPADLPHADTYQSTMKSVWIHCDQCGHCVDFDSPVESQPANLTTAQHEVADTIATWLTEAKQAKGSTTFLQ